MGVHFLQVLSEPQHRPHQGWCTGSPKGVAVPTSGSEEMIRLGVEQGARVDLWNLLRTPGELDLKRYIVLWENRVAGSRHGDGICLLAAWLSHKNALGAPPWLALRADLPGGAKAARLLPAQPHQHTQSLVLDHFVD